jgi:hypothetical protein
VDPVDAEVGEEDEEGELNDVVGGKGGSGGNIVEFGVASDFGGEADGSQKAHEGHRDHALADLETDLVLEVFRMLKGVVVENEVVREGCADKIEDETENPGKFISRATKMWGE